jgi:hypothetical protein
VVHWTEHCTASKAHLKAVEQFMLKQAPTGELDKFGQAAAKVAKMTQFSLTSFKFTKQASKAEDDSVLAIESKTSLLQQLQPSKPSSTLPNSCHGMFADYNKRGHFKDNLAAYMSMQN